MQLPATRFSRLVDPWLERIGQWASWLWMLLLAVIVVNVVLRYVFGEGRIEFEEVQWHLYATGFLLGLGYALKADAHIRVDVLHERFPPTLAAWVELYGILLLLLPFIVVVLVFSVPFVRASFAFGEVSSSPGGLPYRWAIKAMLPLGFLLLLLAALSRLSRVWAWLFLGAVSAAEQGAAEEATAEEGVAERESGAGRVTQ
ncbi:MAG: TRAP transporter small permease subunit [Gammaproteobacteria bacterium]|nr:TRAP transporter small permease subunit [Gammaproteobacteria bacterium]